MYVPWDRRRALLLQFCQILRPSTHGFVQFVMSLDVAVLADSSTLYPWICAICHVTCHCSFGRFFDPLPMDLCNLSCHLTLQFCQIRPATHGFVKNVLRAAIGACMCVYGHVVPCIVIKLYEMCLALSLKCTRVPCIVSKCTRVPCIVINLSVRECLALSLKCTRVPCIVIKCTRVPCIVTGCLALSIFVPK